MNEQVIGFLKGTPNSNKTAISAATGIKGLPLFNLLKKMLGDGQITAQGEGQEATYSFNESYSQGQVSEENTGTDEQDKTEQPGGAVKEEAKEEQPGAIVGDEVKKEEPITKETTATASTSRDNSKYKFNGEEYGKGPLVRAVVAKYVEDHPDTTYKQLKEIFPDTLMKRFGVFANETEAKKLSGSKPRYFLKPEQMIKIKGQKEPIAICNQWTAGLMVNFLNLIRALGYKVK